MKQCDNETVGMLCGIGRVLILILIRACIPLNINHSAERPLTPPESLYQPR